MNGEREMVQIHLYRTTLYSLTSSVRVDLIMGPWRGQIAETTREVELWGLKGVLEKAADWLMLRLRALATVDQMYPRSACQVAAPNWSGKRRGILGENLRGN